jgi:hypothetical protein
MRISSWHKAEISVKTGYSIYDTKEVDITSKLSAAKDGKLNIFIDGKNTKGVEIVVSASQQKSNLNLQQPSLFDFKRRKVDSNLLVLP